MAGVLTAYNPGTVPALGISSVVALGLGTEIVGDALYGKFVKGAYESVVN